MKIGRSFRNERLRHVVASLIVAALLALIGVFNPLDQLFWVGQSRILARPASGQIVFAGTPSEMHDPGQPRRRTELANALDAMNRAGVDHVYLNFAFDKPSNPADDAALARAIADLGPRISLVRWVVTDIGREPTMRATIPQIAGKADQVASDRYVEFFGYTWKMAYAARQSGKAYPTLPAAMAGERDMQRGTFQIDYSVDLNSIPRINISSLAPSAPESDAILRELRGKVAIVGQANTSAAATAAIPGYPRVPASFVSIYAAETLKRGVPMRIDWPITLLGTALILALAAAVPAITRRRRLVYGLVVLTVPVLFYVFALLSIFAFFGPTLYLLANYGGLRYWSNKRRQHSRVDSLTGLPNFLAFRDQLAASGDTAARAVIVAKIHQYEEVLSTVPPAHHADYALQIANRLRAADPQLEIYKDGGKFFAWETLETDATRLENHLRGLRALFAQPLSVANTVVDVGITFGVDNTRQDNPDQKIASANSAADQTTEAHDPIVFARESTENERLWNISLQSKIDQAMRKGEIYVVFQPQICLQTGALIGAEALVRWHDPERGHISPAFFIEQCEQAGRLDTLTRKVLRDALAGAVRMAQDRAAPITMSVNISSTQLLDDRIYDMLTEAIADTGFDPAHVVLEVTETARIADYDIAARVMAKLRSTGAKLSIDDFGVGSANFEALLRLPFDELKIDRSFVARIQSDAKARNITSQLIQLGKKSRITVVAEGVEDGDTLALLRAMGCHLIQGYYISRPVDLEKFLEFQSSSAAMEDSPAASG